MQHFLFKALCEKDINLIYDWFQEPGINQLYARGKVWSFEEVQKKYHPRIQEKDNVPSFIIYKEENPIGFIQYYFLTEHFPEGVRDSNNALFKYYKPDELVGVDLFIADPSNRGKGWGQEILNCFIQKLPSHIRAVIVDPTYDNHKAINCYVKAGFQPTNFSEDTKYELLIKTILKNR